jgi:hypothetical protein
MTNNQDTSPERHEHHSDRAMAPMWVLLLAVIIAVEIGFLPVTRMLFAAVLP